MNVNTILIICVGSLKPCFYSISDINYIKIDITFKLLLRFIDIKVKPRHYE